MAVSVIEVTFSLKPKGAKHGAVFGVMEQTLWLIRVSRYNADRKQVSCQLSVILLTALVQCRGTGRQRSQKMVTVQELNCEYWCVFRIERHEGHDIESRKFKNRDKQMTFIVRVRCCHKFSRVSRYIFRSFEPEDILMYRKNKRRSSLPVLV